MLRGCTFRDARQAATANRRCPRRSWCSPSTPQGSSGRSFKPARLRVPSRALPRIYGFAEKFSHHLQRKRRKRSTRFRGPCLPPLRALIAEDAFRGSAESSDSATIFSQTSHAHEQRTLPPQFQEDL